MAYLLVEEFLDEVKKRVPWAYHAVAPIALNIQTQDVVSYEYVEQIRWERDMLQEMLQEAGKIDG